MRIIVVSNRLPHVLSLEGSKVQFIDSNGGLATSFSSLFTPIAKDGTKRNFLWVGWPGASVSQSKKSLVQKELIQKNCRPVFLSRQLIQDFYDGMSNRILWPLFHYFPEKCSYEESYFSAYKKANELFAQEILNLAKPDDKILIQDYHLFLLPGMLRARMPNLSIGFFLHIPFPSYELFRSLPRIWRSEILDGILGADVVGFHTYDYARYFGHSILREFGLEQSLGKLFYKNRLININVFPLGVDVDRFVKTSKSKVVSKIRKSLNSNVSGRKIILSVDRLDYTKGIDNRLIGFELFLKKYPEFHKKVSLIMLTLPSRIDVNEYQYMKKKIDGLVGRINGSFGSVDWNPVTYLYRHLTFEELVALYKQSSVALITPLRDGMNLVAKEFVAVHKNSTGVLILSEMTGASHELVESLLINPNSKEEIVDGIFSALNMPIPEQKNRLKNMLVRLEKNDVSNWLDNFLNALASVKKSNHDLQTFNLVGKSYFSILDHYRKSHKRLILLDYDGTLVPYMSDPQKVIPPDNLLSLLSEFTSDFKNHVCILSGRDRIYLENWFGKFRMTLVAEHGSWIKEEGARWKLINPLSNEWKNTIKDIMQKYKDLLPGSFIEEKEFSLAFHYRKTDPLLSSDIVFELLEELTHLSANQEINILSGHKVIEVVSASVNKGNISLMLLKKQMFDFVLAIGNDATDESMFSGLLDKGYTIKVGRGQSFAHYSLQDYKNVLIFMKDLIEKEFTSREQNKHNFVPPEGFEPSIFKLRT